MLTAHVCNYQILFAKPTSQREVSREFHSTVFASKATSLSLIHYQTPLPIWLQLKFRIHRDIQILMRFCYPS
jgi:hypothetical protein